MGKTEVIEKVYHPFTKDDLKNRPLILEMLKHEESIFNSENVGQEVYRNELNGTHLEPHFIIQRMVLRYFGFDTSDTSLFNYREIFRTYYKSPFEYDNEVLSTVVYMRENRCVYYKTPDIKLGEIIPNVSLYKLDGKEKVNMHNILGNDYDHALICSFSTS
jgi:hypothetical protein